MIMIGRKNGSNADQNENRKCLLAKRPNYGFIFIVRWGNIVFLIDYVDQKRALLFNFFQNEIENMISTINLNDLES